MTAFSYNNNVPATNNNPSVDQPDMKINTQSIEQLIAVDHVSFNSAGSGPPDGSGGHHLQVTFDSKNTPIDPTDPVSTLYTTSGVATTVADMRFRNDNGIFPVNLIRAYAYVDNAGTILNGINVTSVTPNPAGPNPSYDVVLDTNVVTGTNYGVICTGNVNSTAFPLVVRTSITSASQFTISLSTPATSGVLNWPSTFTFIVLQI